MVVVVVVGVVVVVVAMFWRNVNSSADLGPLGVYYNHRPIWARSECITMIGRFGPALVDMTV